jgi:hypothetical protein
MPSSKHRTSASIPHSASDYGTFCRTVSLGVLGLLLLLLRLTFRRWWRSCGLLGLRRRWRSCGLGLR